MKLTLLLLTCISLGAYATGKAQNINLNLNNTSLEHILEEVSKQSKLRLFYDQQILKNLKIRQINFENASVSTVLSKTLKGKNLTFKIIDGTIVITEKKQTNYEIKGLVSDINGPLQGVTVSVTQTPSIHTITDQNGQYSLRVPENSTVTFRYMGYTDQEFQIDQNRTLNVTLVSSSSELEEIVVVGYGTRKKLI
ncbi:STN domain-containing protein [Sphingobacterium daejeonense]|uniref:STN domain-containing protein n=1 Tax=Sphingobacterium daejeonense TaxID=371142 RepID=UPI0014854C69|nr:STN domain-containing protein [Sphingobacterium daejeonense]